MLKLGKFEYIMISKDEYGSKLEYYTDSYRLMYILHDGPNSVLILRKYSD